jgi:hypothetical protein
MRTCSVFLESNTLNVIGEKYFFQTAVVEKNGLHIVIGPETHQKKCLMLTEEKFDEINMMLEDSPRKALRRLQRRLGFYSSSLKFTLNVNIFQRCNSRAFSRALLSG